MSYQRQLLGCSGRPYRRFPIETRGHCLRCSRRPNHRVAEDPEGNVHG